MGNRAEVPSEVFADGSSYFGDPKDKNIGPSERDIKEVTSLSHELAREDIVVVSKGSRLGRIAETILGRMPKRVAIPAAGLATLLAAACGGGSDEANQPSNTGTNTPDKSPAATLTIKPSTSPVDGGKGGDPTPVATATQIPTVAPIESTPTAVKETPAPVPCEILPQEYCSQAERFTAIRQGKTYTYIGFNLPAGTPLFAPVDGLLQKTQESGEPFSGLLALVIIPVASGGGSAGFSGDLRFDNMLQKDVKSGDVIAYINNTDVKTVKGKDYNLVFGMSKRSPDGPVTDEDILKKLFPDAFETPASGIQQDTPSKSTVTQSYSSVPPQ